jgi:ribosomal protein L31E
MSYVELYDVASRPWASVNEIRKIANNCGRDAATKIRDEIETKIVSEGKKLPKSKVKVVPTSEVLKYLNLNYDFITQMAINEQSVNNSYNSRTR